MPSRENEFPQGVNATPRNRPPDPRSVPAANQGGADSAEDPPPKALASASHPSLPRPHPARRRPPLGESRATSDHPAPDAGITPRSSEMARRSNTDSAASTVAFTMSLSR